MEFSKKIVGEDYHSDEEDFVADGELTVTITLHEYRQLVRAAADAELQIANHERYEAVTRARKLDEENNKLKVELETANKHVTDLQMMLEGQGEDLPWDTPAYDPGDMAPAEEVEGANE